MTVFRRPDAQRIRTRTTGGTAPSLASLISRAALYADRGQTVLGKALADLIAWKSNYRFRLVTENPLCAVVPEQYGLAHVHSVGAIRRQAQETEYPI